MSRFICALTYPAPFPTTLGTSHVVAALTLFSSISTVGALHNVIALNIILKLLISNFITTDTSMRNSSTFEAHFLSTFTSGRTLVTTAASFFPSNKADAAVSWAPFEIRIFFNFYVFPKAQILFVNFRASKLFDIICGESYTALMFHASDLENLTINNFRAQMV
jgi:hypothetical protein